MANPREFLLKEQSSENLMSHSCFVGLKSFVAKFVVGAVLHVSREDPFQ